jgi:hypothetical protein
MPVLILASLLGWKSFRARVLRPTLALFRINARQPIRSALCFGEFG